VVILALVLTESGKDYDSKGVHAKFLRNVSSGKLFMLVDELKILKEKKDTTPVFSFVCPPDNISKFKDAYLLTYLFRGGETNRWFEEFDVEFTHYRLTRAGEMKWDLELHDGCYDCDGIDYPIGL
jgi:hypothetical protein